jgi:hypothetical protein
MTEPKSDTKTEQVVVSHVAVKLPAFWTSDLELCLIKPSPFFGKLESRRVLLNKYYQSIARLPEKLIVSVHDLIRKVRTDMGIKVPYEQLEKRLTASYARSMRRPTSAGLAVRFWEPVQCCQRSTKCHRPPDYFTRWDKWSTIFCGHWGRCECPAAPEQVSTVAVHPHRSW